MAGRALAFSDNEVERMARENYIPVTGDDWYQRRREDAEGKFFRSVADQGPRKGEGGSTRQGIYCLTAAGKLLCYKNAGQAPDVMRQALRQGLAEWKKLSDAERKPSAVKIPDPGPLDSNYVRKPPVNGLVLNVYARSLDHDDKGALCQTQTPLLVDGARARPEAQRDHLWLTEAEWKSLLPANPQQGATFPLPAAIARRIFRFHLVDSTRGEPPMWQREEIRSGSITLTVEELNATGLKLKLEGSALLATDADASKAERGYDARLRGELHYSAKEKRWDRFDLVAAGEHWGEGPYTKGARPGRTPLGVAFELARGGSPADNIPPQAARELNEYLAAK